MSNFKNKTLLISLISIVMLLSFNCNAQFVDAKKKQKTARHGQWELPTAFRDLLPKTVILNIKYPNYNIWQEKLGKIIQDPKTQQLIYENFKKINNMNFTNIKQKLLGFTIVFILSTLVSNAQFVSPKKKQKTVRHGQWHPSSSLKDLLPKTIVLNCKYPNDSIWREKLGNIIEAPKGEETKVKNAYNALFNKADTVNPKIIKEPNAKERALNNRIIAYYAKLCAFVYYADIDKDLDANDHWQKLSDNKRDHFKDRAIEFMRKIDYRGHINGFEKLQYSSKGLLMALQAYDLLKASGNVGQSDLDNMKYSLQWWAKDVYRKANNERYKNMMLYCES